MPEQPTGLGKIQIAEEVVAVVAGVAATESPGLVGMAARTVQEGIAELLHREDLARGVQVRMEDEGAVIDLFVVVEYGVNISQAAREAMERVKSSVEQLCGLTVSRVNLHVQGVRVEPPRRSPGADPKRTLRA